MDDDQLDDFACSLFSDLCEGDGEHSEELDRALIVKHLRLAVEDALASARAKCQTVMVPSEYAALLAWRDRFLDAETNDDAELNLPTPQNICYAIVDAMTLREVHAVISPTEAA